MNNYEYIKITAEFDYKSAAKWFSSKWSVPYEAYIESMEDSFVSNGVPCWYLALDGGKIAGGMGVIENDFHNRKDLAPNVCAVYTEPECRNRGIARNLLRFVCKDMAGKGIKTLYLITDHNGLYEKFGWEYYCDVLCDGEKKPSRVYIHKEN